VRIGIVSNDLYDIDFAVGYEVLPLRLLAIKGIAQSCVVDFAQGKSESRLATPPRLHIGEDPVLPPRI
jgi:hypothetical protein